MKMRVPVILLLLLAGGLLIWFTNSLDRKNAPETPKRWADQAADLNELGGYKHSMAARYIRFADAASSENDAGAECLFRALAHSEQIHEINCADAVRRLGGHYHPPAQVIVFRGKTGTNLTQSLREEQNHYPFYREAIREALESGNRYAGRILIRIAGGDMRQIELLECFIRHPDDDGYAVCPLCGNIFPAEHCDCYCPFCLTPDSDFVHFE